jgi:hypothetical protein
LVFIAPGQEPKKLELDQKPTLAKLYELLGCNYVEMIHVTDEVVMWFDEDGKAQNKPVNPGATLLLEFAGGMPGDWVAGPVLITGIDGSGDICEPDVESLNREIDAYAKQREN